jgi:hypothetical protein
MRVVAMQLHIEDTASAQGPLRRTPSGIAFT